MPEQTYKTHTLRASEAVIDVREDGAWRVRWSPKAAVGSGWVTWAPAPRSVETVLRDVLLSRGGQQGVAHLEEQLAQWQSRAASAHTRYGHIIHKLQNKVSRQRRANRRGVEELNRVRETLLDIAASLDALGPDDSKSPYDLADELRDLATPIRVQREGRPGAKAPGYRPIVLATSVEAGREYAAQTWPMLNPISQVAVLTPKNVRAFTRVLSNEAVHWVERVEDPDQFTAEDRAYVEARIGERRI